MSRVIVGAVLAALLALVVSCTSTPEPEPPEETTGPVAVEPDEVERHQASSGTPISFHIEVPEGATQVGPLIRQRRMEVVDHTDLAVNRSDAFDNDTDSKPFQPQTHDPEEPIPPDFTSAMLRMDDDPGQVLEGMLEQIASALPESEIDPGKWADHCNVVGGFYTGCHFEVTGKTEEGERIGVELTVDPGNPTSKMAPAGSLLRPVMTLTIEQDTSFENGGGEDNGKSDKAADDNAAQQTSDDLATNNDNGRSKNNDRDRSPANRDSDKNGGNRDKSDGKAENGPPKWPNLTKERRARPGDAILTPCWKVRRDTEVILSSSEPKIAMLAVRDGADADAIARSYARKFADEATTPKMDEVEDLNERSITYTPRNDGSGPDIAVTVVATARGNYIELLYSQDPRGDGDSERRNEKRTKDPKKKSQRDAANRTRSRTG